mmetsp:Transcript_23654/g.42818  ORF Transcript_23654/g.42818 Transcript_23654/m.42818 type:complete len:640 (-) Transcript_23654:79-1998(-)
MVGLARIWLLLIPAYARRELHEGDVAGPPRKEDVVRGFLKAVDFPANLAKNCLDDVAASVGTLQDACKAESKDVRPMLVALRSFTAILQRPECIEGSEPLPPAFSRALDLVNAGALEVPLVTQAAMQETQAFVKKSQPVFQQKEGKRCYQCVGQDAGQLLLSLSGQVGAIPMLEGLAQAFNGAEVTLDQLMGCSDAVTKGAAVVKSMEISLRPPKGIFWRFNRIGPMAFVKKLKEMADWVHAAQEVLQSCQPQMLPPNERVDAFKEALQLADDVSRNGQELIIMGVDVAKKIQAMGADAAKGDWKAVGLQIGSIADLMSTAQSGLSAVGHFLADVTTKSDDISKVRVCMQQSQSFLQTCHGTFTPLPKQSSLPGKMAVARLHDLLGSAEATLSSCKSSIPRELGNLMPPEMRVMAKSLDMIVRRADDATSMLIKGYDLAEDANQVAAALNKHNYGEASEQIALMLGQINDNLNGDSFLKGLLANMGNDFTELSSLASCVGDTQRFLSDLRTAGQNLEISPRKWTIDKKNCDAAMEALKDAVQAIHNMLSSCSHEIEALKQLLKALMGRQWDNASGQINMFKQNIGEPLWQLAQAIGGRDWTKAGQALAHLAVTALHHAEEAHEAAPKKQRLKREALVSH